MPECPVKMKTTLKINLLSLLSYFDFNKLLHELFITIRNQSKGLLAIVPCATLLSKLFLRSDATVKYVNLKYATLNNCTN